MGTLGAFYTSCAALTNLDQRRWCLGAGHRLDEYVQRGYPVATAKTLVLASPPYANALTGAGLTATYNAITTGIDVYVSPSGSDAANGNSPGTALRTLAQAQSVLTAGQTLGLLRGGRWRETLTIPANNIRVTAYGGDPRVAADGYVTNAPIIDGGEFQTGWSAYNGGADVRNVVDAFTGTPGQLITARDPTPGNFWTKHDLFTANTPAISGVNTLRRAGTPDAGGQYVVMANPELASPVMDDYYAQCDVVVKSVATDFAVVLARFFSYKDSGYGFVFGGASGSLTLRRYDQGATTTLGTGTALTLSAGQIWTIRIEVQGTTIRGMVKAQGAGTWAQTVTQTDTTHQIASHGGLRMGSATAVAPSDTAGLHISNFEIGPLGTVGAPVNTYQSTLAASPPVVDNSGQLALIGKNSDQLNNGEYYWQNGTIYLRRDAGIPSNTDVVVATRENGIVCDTKSGVTIDGIAVEHASGRSIWFNNSSAPTVRNCMAQLSSGSGASTTAHGIFAFTGTSNNWTVANSILRNSTTDGVYIQGPVGGTLADSVIGPCISTFADCVQVEGSAGVAGNVTISRCILRMNSISPKGAAILFGDGHIVEDTTIEGTGGTGRISGSFGVSITGDHMIVRGCVFKNVTNDALRITDSVSNSVTRTDHLVHHNVFIDCGVGIYLVNPGTVQKYYANTITNTNRIPQFNGVADYQLRIDQTIAGEIIDNIVWNGSGGGLSYKVGNTSGSLTSDYNLIGPEGTGFINYAATAFATMAAYVSSKSKDAHSITGNPLFVNLGGVTPNDYILRTGSPAIGSGTVVAGIVGTPDMGAR